MKTITFILALFASLLLVPELSAQEFGIPYLQCHYAEKSIRNLQKPERITRDEMILSISKECSEFYSRWNKALQELKDSVFGNGGSASDFMSARHNLVYPESNNASIIYKNVKGKGILTLTDDVLLADYIYDENLELPQWNITEEKDSVAGYACQLAEAKFRGRTWRAWFTMDIPISDGPWKLCGLPGLILKAEDSEKHYQFTCIEIKAVSQGKPISIRKGKRIRCTREEYIENIRLLEEDISTYVQKHGKPPLMTLQKDGSLKTLQMNVKFNYIER